MQTSKIQESVAATQYRGPMRTGTGSDSAPSFAKVLAGATSAQQSFSFQSAASTSATETSQSQSASAAAIAGMIHLGYNGQFPPQYPPGYPPAMQEKMNQLLQNPNISTQTKSKAWSFAVASPYMRSTVAGADVNSTGYSEGNYNSPGFNADSFWADLVQGTSRAGAAFTDLANAFKSVS